MRAGACERLIVPAKRLLVSANRYIVHGVHPVDAFDACPFTTPQDMMKWARQVGLAVAGPDAPRRAAAT